MRWSKGVETGCGIGAGEARIFCLMRAKCLGYGICQLNPDEYLQRGACMHNVPHDPQYYLFALSTHFCHTRFV